MKSFTSLSSGLAGLALWGLALGAATAAEKDTPVVVRARTAAPTVAAPVTPTPAAPPVSTFVIPRKITEGRDPFFPNSTRVYGTDAAVTNRPPSIAADLVLKGISGTPEQPLAIINTTTFTTGEMNEVIFKNGRLRIQCLEINMTAGTVLIQLGGERRELRLGQK